MWQPNGGDPFPKRDGLTVREAIERHSEDTNAALVYAIRKLCEALECKVTIRTAMDYEDALDVIYNFHGWTFDEIQSCFAMIRTGRIGSDFYERFKAPQLHQCMRQYADMRAQHHLRNQAKYMDGIHDEAPATLRTAQQLSHVADLLQLPAYEPKRPTLNRDEGYQSIQTIAEAKGETQTQTPDLCTGS